MRKSFLPIIAALALVVAACGGGASDQTTTSSDPTTSTGGEEPVSTTSAAPEVDLPEARLLSYTLSAGDEYQYEVDLDQHIEMTATGDEAALGEEEFPGEATIDLTGTAVFTHSVAAGAEEGTYEITITGDFSDLSVTGTVDGEPIDSEGEIPDFAGMEPVDVTVVVDEQGNLVADGEMAEDPLAGALGGLGGLDSMGTAPGLDPGQFVGPAFSDEEVTVGDTWSDEIETPGFGEDPIVTSVASTVTGIEELDGVEVFVIETNTKTTPIEFDLAEFFIGLLSAFGPPEGSDEEAAEFEAMLDQITFLISIDETVADSVTWFDHEAGLARRYTLVAGTNMVMDMNIPDETTGELVGFNVEMALDQEIGYRLLSGPTA